MHTEYDTQTVTNTLALYGVKRHSAAYYRVRTIVRATWMLAILPIAYLISLTH